MHLTTLDGTDLGIPILGFLSNFHQKQSAFRRCQRVDLSLYFPRFSIFNESIPIPKISPISSLFKVKPLYITFSLNEALNDTQHLSI